MRLEHHLVGGYVRYISPHIIIYYYKYSVGVSWPSGLVHRTQVLVLSEIQNVGSIPEQDT